MKTQFYNIVEILASIAYFLPVFIMLFRKLWKDSYFLYLAVYWTIGATVNFVTNLPTLGSATIETVTVIYNMIDVPLILLILWYTSFSAKLAKILKFVISAYIIAELILVLKFGLTYEAIKYIIGVGVFIVLVTLFWEIRFYLQQLEHTNREKAMLFIYAALVFEYASYIIVYICDYFVLSADYKDKLLIYYISTLIGVSIASCGFFHKKNKESLVYR